MRKKFSKKIWIILALFLPLACWIGFFIYDESLSESARLSKEFNLKIESILKSNHKEVRLKDLTDFEWDVVCFYGEEVESLGESIDLWDYELTEQIGYKPKFLIRATYYVPYDFVGLVFSDSNRKKVKIMHRVWRNDYKSIFSDLDLIVVTKTSVTKAKKKLGYLGPNECFRLNKNHNI